jgi:hypothetical protein
MLYHRAIPSTLRIPFLLHKSELECCPRVSLCSYFWVGQDSRGRKKKKKGERGRGKVNS